LFLTGVGAAIVAAATTILVERRRHGYEDRTRFIDLRRERYSEMLRESDEHIRTLRRQHAAVVEWEASGAEPLTRPSVPLGSTDPLGHLAAEIALLGRSTAVGDAAEAMYQALVGLGGLRRGSRPIPGGREAGHRHDVAQGDPCVMPTPGTWPAPDTAKGPDVAVGAFRFVSSDD
jgi:hypothetical protein